MKTRIWSTLLFLSFFCLNGSAKDYTQKYFQARKTFKMKVRFHPDGIKILKGNTFFISSGVLDAKGKDFRFFFFMYDGNLRCVMNSELKWQIWIRHLKELK